MIFENGRRQSSRMSRKNGIGIAADSSGRKSPAFLPEIKPAQQKQTVQTCWSSERLTLNWILEMKHFVFFIRSSSCPVSRL
jgi:hypothetical protein